MPFSRSVLITCEHGGNKIPKAYLRDFQGAHHALDSHRGWDPGALKIARSLARSFHSPLVESQVSRLLVDLNRSVGHPRLYSEWSRGFGRDKREKTLDLYYRPYREKVFAECERLSKSKQATLFSVHSFTPELDGEVRNCEIGILYDPRRRPEREWAEYLKRRIRETSSGLRVRSNYPYHGNSDGLPTDIRRIYSPQKLRVMEFEFNQGWLHRLEKTGDFNRMLKWLTPLVSEALSKA